jgi:hypothetical protein
MTRGALLGVKICVHQWREAWAEMVALGEETLDLVAEGSARWSRVMLSLLPAVGLTRPPEHLVALSQRFYRAEPDAGARGAYVRAAAWMISAFSITAQREPARVFRERMHQVAVDANDLLTPGHTSAALAQYYLMLEHAPWQAVLVTRDGAEKLSRCGDRSFYPIVQRVHGEAWTALGDRSRAEAALRESLVRSEESGEPFMVRYAQIYMARFLSIHLEPDHLDEAEALARLALEDRQPMSSGMARGVLARVAARRGELAAAEEHARLASESLVFFGGLRWEAIAVHIDVVRRLRAVDAVELGTRALAEYEQQGISNYGEVGMRLALAEAHHAAGNVDAACDALRHALRVVDSCASSIPEPAVRESYLTQVPESLRARELARAWLA